MRTSARSLLLLSAASALLLAGCSSDSGDDKTFPDFAVSDAVQQDLFQPADGPSPGDGPLDGQPPGDGQPADGAGPDKGCTVGTADHCTKCGDKCPGPEDSATTRVCVNAKCDIQCKGDYYDVNGAAVDGCEHLDALALNGTESAAKDLGAVTDCDKDKTSSGAIPSDERLHITAPVSRPNGTPRWFKLAITDKAFCAVNAKVVVDLSALPAKADYKVEAKYVCKNKTTLKSTIKSSAGGKSVTLSPSVKCTTMGDDSGTLYLEIKKTSGSTTHSDKQFKLTITP